MSSIMWKSQRLDHPEPSLVPFQVPKLELLYHVSCHIEKGIFPYMASDLTLKHGSRFNREFLCAMVESWIVYPDWGMRIINQCS